MDVEEQLSLMGPVVDLTCVDSIHRKRITAFVNHFLIRTAHFLNDVACLVDSKLMQVDQRLQKLEASIILLETKLSSIPGLDTGISIENTQEIATDTYLGSCKALETELAPQAEEIDCQIFDESLLKYVKMLHVGVPEPAVKLKMQQDGVSVESQNLVFSH